MPSPVRSPVRSPVQRIRDPVHNLIEFGADDSTAEVEMALWAAVQTAPFQRLRRIKQLGFSELVFPGATHTRFAHSLGVFQTARLLLAAIRRSMGSASLYSHKQAEHVMAAALLHDVGHGMFSHAFEAVGQELGLAMARHESVSVQLIAGGAIAEALDSRLGAGFAGTVAELIGRTEPVDLYDSVVSSQFDADRLDYVQRDRMMTGVHSGAVDVTWLLHNLEVATLTVGDRRIETLVLGPKAFHVAESYVLALFHLYPNVYLHKTTRGAEMVLRDLIRTLFTLTRAGHGAATGLPGNHPILRFALEPGRLDRAQALDDTVLWGALPMLAEASDATVRLRAGQLLNRNLLESLDIRGLAEAHAPPGERRERTAFVDQVCARVMARSHEAPGALFDRIERSPYKRFGQSGTMLNQIHILENGQPRDMAERSAVVANAEPFRVCRAYVTRGDTAVLDVIRNIVGTECAHASGSRRVL